MGDEFNAVAFGKVLGQLHAIGREIAEIKSDQRETNEKLGTLLAAHQRQKGFIKAVVLISNLIVGAVAWAVTTFFKGT